MTIRSSVEIDDLLKLTVQELIIDQSIDTQGIYSVSDSNISSALSSFSHYRNSKIMQSSQLQNTHPFNNSNPNSSSHRELFVNYEKRKSSEQNYGREQKENIDNARPAQMSYRYDSKSLKSSLLKHQNNFEDNKQAKSNAQRQQNISQSYDSEVSNKSRNDIGYSEYSPSAVQDSRNLQANESNAGFKTSKNAADGLNYNLEGSQQYSGLAENSSFLNLEYNTHQQLSSDFYRPSPYKKRQQPDIFMQNSMMFNQDNVQLESPMNKEIAPNNFEPSQMNRLSNNFEDYVKQSQDQMVPNQITESIILEQDLKRLLSKNGLSNYQDNQSSDQKLCGIQITQDQNVLKDQQKLVKSHPLQVASQSETPSRQSSESMPNNITQPEQVLQKSQKDLSYNQIKPNNSDLNKNSQQQNEHNSKQNNPNLNSYILTSQQLQQAASDKEKSIVVDDNQSEDAKSDATNNEFQDMEIDYSNYTDPQQSVSSSKINHDHKISSETQSLHDAQEPQAKDDLDLNEKQHDLDNKANLLKTNVDAINIEEQSVRPFNNNSQNKENQEENYNQEQNEKQVDLSTKSTNHLSTANEVNSQELNELLDQNVDIDNNLDLSLRIKEAKNISNTNKFQIQSLDWAQKEPKSKHLKQFLSEIPEQQQSNSSIVDNIFKCQQNFLETLKLSEERELPKSKQSQVELKKPQQKMGIQFRSIPYNNQQKQANDVKVQDTKNNELAFTISNDQPDMSKMDQIIDPKQSKDDMSIPLNAQVFNQKASIDLQQPTVQTSYEKLENLKSNKDIHSAKFTQSSVNQSLRNFQSMDPHASVKVQVPLHFLQSSMQHQQQKIENNLSDPKEIVVVQQEILQGLNKLMVNQQQEIQDMYNFFQLESQVSKFVTEQLMLKLQQSQKRVKQFGS